MDPHHAAATTFPVAGHTVTFCPPRHGTADMWVDGVYAGSIPEDRLDGASHALATLTLRDPAACAGLLDDIARSGQIRRTAGRK